MVCPTNSWSSGHGATMCQCLGGYYRENESDLSSACRPVPRIDASRLDVYYVNEDKVNISLVPPSTIDSTGSNVRVELKCFSCSSRGYFRDECDQSCFISSSTSMWLVILNNNNNHKNSNLQQPTRVKIQIRQELNGRELARSAVYLTLAEKPALNERVTCEAKDVMSMADMMTTSLLFKSLGLVSPPKIMNHHRLVKSPSPSSSSSSVTCLNISLDLSHQLAALYPNIQQHNLIEKVRTGRLVKFNAYALLAVNDYHLIPAVSSVGASTGGSNGYAFDPSLPMATTAASNKHFERLDLSVQQTASSPDTLKNLILNTNGVGSVYSLLVCNNLDDIERVRLELRFSRGDRASTTTTSNGSNNNNNDAVGGDMLDVYAIDLKLLDVCLKNGALKLMRQYDDHSSSASSSSLIHSLKNSLSDNQSSSTVSASSHFKVHVLLPITLSFLFVTAVILLALFVRR